MTTPDQLPPPETPPTLGQILRLQTMIETAARRQTYRPGWRPPQLSDTETLAVYHIAAGQPTMYGNKIGHVERRVLQPNGRFAPDTYYFVIRDGDDTTTKVVKRPPAQLPRRSLDISAGEADEITQAFMRALDYDDENLTQTREAISQYAEAEAEGFFDIYGNEVEALITDIAIAYGIPPA